MLVGIRPYIPLQMSIVLPNEEFYLLFEVVTFIGFMTIVIVKPTELGHISSINIIVKPTELGTYLFRGCLVEVFYTVR